MLTMSHSVYGRARYICYNFLLKIIYYGLIDYLKFYCLFFKLCFLQECLTLKFTSHGSKLKKFLEGEKHEQVRRIVIDFSLVEFSEC